MSDESIKIKVGKFYPLTRNFTLVFILLSYLLFTYWVLTDDLPQDEQQTLYLCIPLFAFVLLIGLRRHIILKKIEKNPTILELNEQGVFLPYTFQFFRPNFIKWHDVYEAREITSYGRIMLVEIAIFYNDHKSQKPKKIIIPYTLGKGQALNFCKEEVIFMINNMKQKYG